jgi:virginiamycin A acetyltransferase
MSEHLRLADISYPLQIKWRNEFVPALRQKKVYIGGPGLHVVVYKLNEKINITHQSLVEPYGSLPRRSFISIGFMSYVHSNLPGSTHIGRYCSLAAGISDIGARHNMDCVTTNPIIGNKQIEGIIRNDFDPDYRVMSFPEKVEKPIVIGNDVWIGGSVLISPGVKIGDGAVVGARSIVTKDVPPYAVVAGAPATVKRMRFSEKTVEKLLATKWWQYNFTQLPRCWDDLDRFIGELAELVAGGRIELYEPETVDVGKLLVEVERQITGVG